MDSETGPAEPGSIPESTEQDQAASAPKRRRPWVVWAVVIGAVVLLFYGSLIVFLVSAGDGFGVLGPDSVALIRIEGVITGSSADAGLFDAGVVTPGSIIDQLKEAEMDPTVGAILLRVNSPGGTAAAGQEIHRELSRVEKPVVVSVGDVGASAAYLIATAADSIVASPASQVGSIGVIIALPNLAELYKKVGVDLQVISKGKHKDLGNPARALTPEERTILEDQTEVVYQDFIKEVAKGRDMPVAKVRELANGLTFPGSEAKKLGLIDTIGNFEDALQLAADRGGIEGDPLIVEFGEFGILEELSSFFFLAKQALRSLSALPTAGQVAPIPR